MANNTTVKAIVTVIFASGILTFMGYGIVNNDIRNTKDHISIRKDMVEMDKELNDKVEEVKDIVTDVRLEQRELTTIVKERFRVE